MKSEMYLMCLGISACVVLAACGLPSKQKQFDLYGLHGQTAVPTDNDSYYTPPKAASHCTNTINDSPSCGGI